MYDGIAEAPVGLIDVLGWVEPENYGAKGDGTTDDTAAFAAALAALNSSPFKLLKLRAKNYRLASTGNGLTPVAGTTVQGDPGGTTIVFDAPSSAYSALFSIGYSNCTFRGFSVRRNSDFTAVVFDVNLAVDRITFSDLDVDGAQGTYGTTVAHGIRYGNAAGSPSAITGIKVLDSKIHHCDFGLFCPSSSTSHVSRFTVSRCEFHHNYGDDCNFNSPSTGGGGGTVKHVVISDCHFHDNLSGSHTGGFAVDFAGTQYGTVSGCTFENYPYEAFHAEDLAKFLLVRGCTFNACATVDYSCVGVVTGVTHLVIEGCTFDQTTVTPTGTRQSQGVMYLDPSGGAAPSRITFSHNTCLLSSAWNGVQAYAMTQLTFAGNRFEASGTVTSGAYSGGTNFGLNLVNGGPHTVTGNAFIGLGQGMHTSTTGDLAPMNSGIVVGNTFVNCNLGLGAQSTGSVILGMNFCLNCVDSILTGSNGVGPAHAGATIGNYASGCHNLMGVGRFSFFSSDSTPNGRTLAALNCDDKDAYDAFPLPQIASAGIGLPILHDADAGNDTMYLSLDQGVPVYKNGSGVPNHLY